MAPLRSHWYVVATAPPKFHAGGVVTVRGVPIRPEPLIVTAVVAVTVSTTVKGRQPDGVRLLPAASMGVTRHSQLPPAIASRGAQESARVVTGSTLVMVPTSRRSKR